MQSKYTAKKSKYDALITLDKGAEQLLYVGISGLLIFFSSYAENPDAGYAVAAVAALSAVLRMLKNYIKHRND